MMRSGWEVQGEVGVGIQVQILVQPLSLLDDSGPVTGTLLKLPGRVVVRVKWEGGVAEAVGHPEAFERGLGSETP